MPRSRPEPRAQVLRHETSHTDHRIEEYPSVGDQLDAMIKLARCLIDLGLPIPPDTVALVERCEGIKKRYPKQAPPAEL